MHEMVKIMVNSVHYSHALTKVLNKCVKSGSFPYILKYTDVISAFLRQTKVTKTY